MKRSIAVVQEPCPHPHRLGNKAVGPAGSDPAPTAQGEALGASSSPPQTTFSAAGCTGAFVLQLLCCVGQRSHVPFHLTYRGLSVK